ncbi:MAG: hypothetical protein UHS47_03315 [Oscillospiraceae bacterium]|jgi:hypothetical protein|nr:hypothetical protein [Oscillospiraceae bacterium]
MLEHDCTESVKNMRNRTVRLDREGDYWTAEERESLAQKFHDGVGITAIALELQRTESAVIQQIEAMDLFGRKKKTSSPKQPRCLCSSCQLDPALCPHRERCPKLQEET